jgi:uncharacterized protein (TIGR04255 family)
MFFPESERVIYGKNPLVEVICQLRFPRILKIDTELPAAFQERIRQAYPQFSQSPKIDLGLVSPELARLVGLDQVLGSGQQKFEFVSADRDWKVTFTSHSLALTTTKYHRWEQFKDHLAEPLSALHDIYQPAFFTRIGLRYKDLIRRSSLGLAGVTWRELLASHVLGELGWPGIEEMSLQVARDILFDLTDQGCKIRVQHGIAKSDGDPETCYLIDCDFFSEAQTEPKDAIRTLDRLNNESGRLFRWCITQRLHASMDPRPA